MKNPDTGNALFTALYLIGGLLCGGGILNLYYSFGAGGHDLNGNFQAVGFSGLDNIAMLPLGTTSFGLIAAGIVCLVFANSRSWKETNGY